MELINATRMVTGYAMGIEPGGRELLVVVVKGTFGLPRTPGEPLRLADEQVPLVMADTFTGEPGLSAPVLEADFAPRKHRCDVLLVGSAYAPDARPADRVPVGFRVGNLSKSFAVAGDRFWSASASGIRSTPPQPFVVKPISYDFAFGGTDCNNEDPAKHAAYMRNPVGRGFHEYLESEWVDGTPLPSNEELDRPVQQPDESYPPMAFGPVGRGWEPRYRYAGTYDDRWLDEYFPFLPPDFDEAYFQAAPHDQQLPLPVGELQISLFNLTPDGRRSFTVPGFEAAVNVFPKKGDREDYKAILDTIVLEPDHERLTLTWRVARPLKKSMFEIAQVLVGKKGGQWWRQREEVAFPIPVVAAGKSSLPQGEG